MLILFNHVLFYCWSVSDQLYIVDQFPIKRNAYFQKSLFYFSQYSNVSAFVNLADVSSLHKARLVGNNKSMNDVKGVRSFPTYTDKLNILNFEISNILLTWDFAVLQVMDEIKTFIGLAYNYGYILGRE